MLEIHVDVRRLSPRGADETFEQDIDLLRIDRGDAQAIADHRIRRRSAALAQDAPRPREADDVEHGQEIGGEVQLRDQGEFVGDPFSYLGRNAFGITSLGALPGQPLQGFLRGSAVGDGIDRIFVAQLVQAEPAPFGDLDGSRDRVGIGAEQPRHFVAGFEVALGIGEQPISGLVNGDMVADAGQYVLQRTPGGGMGMDVVGGDQGHADDGRDLGQAMKADGIVAAIKNGCRDIEPFIEVFS